MAVEVTATRDQQETPVQALEADGTAELPAPGVASSEDATMLLSLASCHEERQPAVCPSSTTASGKLANLETHSSKVDDVSDSEGE
eukprot:245592-Pleurochrysis_carterae.AAC.1